MGKPKNNPQMGTAVGYVISTFVCTAIVFVVLFYKSIERHRRVHRIPDIQRIEKPLFADERVVYIPASIGYGDLDDGIKTVLLALPILYFVLGHHMVGLLVAMSFMLLIELNAAAWAKDESVDLMSDKDARLFLMAAWPITLLLLPFALVVLMIGVMVRLVIELA